MSLTSLTLKAALDGLAKKDFSAEELAKAHIDAIAAANGALNAYVLETPEKALDMARASDARRARGEAGPLEGASLGVKDLFCTDGIRTTAGSKILDGFKPPYESTVTANLWRDGAVMLGKLNMDEFAMGSSNETSFFGPVNNPWRAAGSNRNLTPGGSSGDRPAPWPPTFASGPPLRTPAAPSASRRPSPARWASSRPMAAARASAWWPSPRLWTRPAPSPRRWRTPP